jgi:hypothetical protein
LLLHGIFGSSFDSVPGAKLVLETGQETTLKIRTRERGLIPLTGTQGLIPLTGMYYSLV